MLPRGASHLHLSRGERFGLAVGSAIAAFLDPERADMIALLGETTGAAALARLRAQMRATPDGAWLLAHRPRVRGAAYEPAALARSMPPRSFGAAYGEYMSLHGYSAEARAPVLFVADPELAYVMARYREVHDFLHVLTGLPTSVVGEVALKWLEMAQTGLPVAALSALVGPLRLAPRERAQLLGELAPWALRTAAACPPLLAVRYEELLPLPLDEARARLRITPAPALAAAEAAAAAPPPPRLA